MPARSNNGDALFPSSVIDARVSEDIPNLSSISQNNKITKMTEQSHPRAYRETIYYPTRNSIGESSSRAEISQSLKFSTAGNRFL